MKRKSAYRRQRRDAAIADLMIAMAVLGLAVPLILSLIQP